MTTQQLSRILSELDEAGPNKIGVLSLACKTGLKAQDIHKYLKASNDNFFSSDSTQTFRMNRFGAREGSVEEILHQIEREKIVGTSDNVSLHFVLGILGCLLSVALIFSGASR